MDEGYENKSGSNCPLKNPEVLIRFRQPNLAYISKVEVQRDYLNLQGNVQQIEAVFLNAHNSIIKNEVTGQPIKWTSSNDTPIIKGYFRDVRGLQVKVLKTDNNENVKRLRLKITGCYSLGL